ncbi:hypothetical protein RFI_35422, partial [Reticulomyxa filosa]
LSFGSNWYKKNKHASVMKYVRIWNNILDMSNKSNEFNNCNQWTPFTDNHNHPITIGREMIIILECMQITFKDILSYCFEILNEDNNHLYIIGEGDSGYGTSTNMKIKLSKLSFVIKSTNEFYYMLSNVLFNIQMTDNYVRGFELMILRRHDFLQMVARLFRHYMIAMFEYVMLHHKNNKQETCEHA